MNANDFLTACEDHAASARRRPACAPCAAMFLGAMMFGAIHAAGSDADPKPAGPGAATPAVSSSAAEAPKPAKTAKADLDHLTGRGAADVEAALGKPTGKLQTPAGALWLYAGWRVQFDKQDRVSQVEKDEPIRLAKLDPQFVAQSEALRRASSARSLSDAEERARINAELQTPKVRVVSNGGETIDLPALLAPGKITLVDFYADWCGPCKRLGPELERRVKEDADVVLVKVDIVKWGTPVTRQFGIDSIPSVRVFNRQKEQVGNPTPSLAEVVTAVNKAKGL